MSDKKFEEMIRDYLDAMEKKDINRAVSFFSDDAVWNNPKGVYTGKKEITEYFTWLFATLSDMKFVDDGVGIIIQGNKGVYQHILECTIRGTKRKVPTFCTYLFNGQKCEIHRTIKAEEVSLSRNR